MRKDRPLLPSRLARSFVLLCACGVLSGIALAGSAEADVAAPMPAAEVPPSLDIPHAIDLTAPTPDLWGRVRNGFLMPNLEDEMVARQQQYYQSNPEYLRRMVERSRLYLHHIVGELEQRGMPTELALLPMVESAYNPLAYSPAQASGLWQFIPSTGKFFHLEQNWWQDQRRDIVASTSAALDYLQYLYEFHGDWHLALASYNWGEGAVERAKRKNAAKGLPTDFSSLALPNETRQYVPKLQALKNIFANPELVAELGIPEVPNQPYFHILVTDTAMDIELAARFAGMPLEAFAALNPAHNRPVIPAQSTLVIPAERVAAFQENLRQYDAPLIRWQAYTLKTGETLETIAPRFGLSAANLRLINGIPPLQGVDAGATLLTPAQGDAALEHADFLALAARPDAPFAAARFHAVRSGETLSGIARKYRMSVPALKRLNQLKNNRIRAGTRLVINPAVAAAQSGKPAYLLAANAARAPAGEPAFVAPKAHPASKTAHAARHVVQKGDTLFSIARRYRVRLDDLMRWNRQAGKILQIGTTLRIRKPES
ncbi:MAG: LysM peptidoglycan-binding domain-containing protein [Zoogloeaceae bacterium]|nr:LysM peptidoglycan-binding domain-containing protein [Zoogloeaceae bacterium]